MSGRYDKCPQLIYARADGAQLRYLALRILPQGASVASGARTTVTASERDRLDLVANRVLSNPMLGWQIADANDAIDPFELCKRTGDSLAIPSGGL
jgi:hypothetical protein